MDPGQRVTWTVKVPGRWTIPAHMDGDVYHGPTGKWIKAVSYTRTGIIWSVATSASCWWVQPDDDPATPWSSAGRARSSLATPGGRALESRERAGWRDGIRRAENVRRRGVFAVVDSRVHVALVVGPRARRGRTSPGTLTRSARAAEGKPRDDGGHRPAGTGPRAPWTCSWAGSTARSRARSASTASCSSPPPSRRESW